MIRAQYDKLVICKKLESFTRIRDLKVLLCAYLLCYIQDSCCEYIGGCYL